MSLSTESTTKGDTEKLTSYISTFVQRQPRYAVKAVGGRWRTKRKPLGDPAIQDHLAGQYWVGVLGKWYPGYAILDLDAMPKGQVKDIRGQLGLDSDNSMLFTSESLDSYHILIAPQYNQKPPTVNLLNQVLSPFAKANGVEIYPQATRTIRLPFGLGQDAVDIEYAGLTAWSEKLWWFGKLDPFDLKTVPQHQTVLPLQAKGCDHVYRSTYTEGQELLSTGLITPHSRHDAQFAVLYSLWRQNTTREAAVAIVWSWIRRKHNGYSVEIICNPRAVKREIERQASRIWGNYTLAESYPDDPHNGYLGWVAKPDLEGCMMLAAGNLPKAKFLFNLVKWCYPRRYRTFINLHSDHLKAWCKRNYKRYLADLEAAGIVHRYASYQVDRFAKSVRLNWPFRNTGYILVDNRSPDTFEDTVRTAYSPEEFRELAKKAGNSRIAAINMVQRIFGGVTNVDT